MVVSSLSSECGWDAGRQASTLLSHGSALATHRRGNIIHYWQIGYTGMRHWYAIGMPLLCFYCLALSSNHVTGKVPGSLGVLKASDRLRHFPSKEEMGCDRILG